MRYCYCGKSFGRYIENNRAEIGGLARALGVDNKEFLNFALGHSDNPPTFWRKDYGDDLERIEDDRISAA